MGFKRFRSLLSSKDAILHYTGFCQIRNSIVSARHDKDTNISVRIAVDIMNYINVYRSNVHAKIYRLMTSMLISGIIPVCIFDGVPDKEKYNTINKRTSKRIAKIDEINKLKDKMSEKQKHGEDTTLIEQCINDKSKKIFKITNELINSVKALLKAIHVPFFTAAGEADYLCAKMYHANVIDGALSDDIDFLAFGIGRIFYINPSEKKGIFEWNLNTILSKLSLSFDQFLNLCMLFESSYHHPKIIISKSTEIYDMFVKLDYSITKMVTKYSICSKKYTDSINEIMTHINNSHNIFSTRWKSEILPDKKIQIRTLFEFTKFIKNRPLEFKISDKNKLIHEFNIINHQVKKTIFSL